jgi:hypothetical protein
VKHGPAPTRRFRHSIGHGFLASAAVALGAVTHAAAAAPPPPPFGPEAGDRACLRALAEAGVPFVERSAVRGIRTPIEIVGPFRGVRLLSRGKRPALMDCALARTLADAAPIFHAAGVTGLSFSAAYDYRTRRGSTELSEHAHGLAIDVHAFETTGGRLDVERDFSRASVAGAGWGQRAPGALAACIGAPPSAAGRTLRALACGLQRHPGFRLILTPDDNQDHHDHFHLESHGDDARSWLAARDHRPVAHPVSHARRSESGRAVHRRRHPHRHTHRR